MQRPGIDESVEVAEVRRGFDDEQFERALARFMGRYLGAGSTPSAGNTSLYTFFGYFGLFCGTVLVLRVLVAVFNDGLN